MAARARLFCCAPFMLEGVHAKACPTVIEAALEEMETPRTLVPRPADAPPLGVLGRVVPSPFNKPPGKAN